MASLPLNLVYVDGARDNSRLTTGRLPNGDIINITDSYTKLLSFFTSGDISPMELRDLGYKKLETLLNQVSYTGNIGSVLTVWEGPTGKYCLQTLTVSDR